MSQQLWQDTAEMPGATHNRLPKPLLVYSGMFTQQCQHAHVDVGWGMMLQHNEHVGDCTALGRAMGARTCIHTNTKQTGVGICQVLGY